MLALFIFLLIPRQSRDRVLPEVFSLLVADYLPGCLAKTWAKLVFPSYWY
jgi:hypothetical protein